MCDGFYAIFESQDTTVMRPFRNTRNGIYELTTTLYSRDTYYKEEKSKEFFF